MDSNKMESNNAQFLSIDYLKHIMLAFRQMKQFAADPLVIVGADGVWLEDLHGKRYLDGISSSFTVTVGHNNRRVIEAIKDQLDQIAFVPPLHATNTTAVQLAKKIADITPSDLSTVKLLSGGSETTETAIKLARQYHRQTGHPQKYKIISHYGSYHGATFGALSATGKPGLKWMYEPTLPGFVHVWPPNCYRCPFHLTYPDCGIRCASIVGDTIEMEGPETVAAIILEPISIHDGIVVPPDEFLPLVRDICDRHNIILIFDEVRTGFGRTGKMFAAQTFATLPDILCMGKGISSGYAPLGAVAFRNHIAAAFWGEDDQIAFSHGHTYAGNPVSSAAGLASIAEIEEMDLPRRARKLGARLRHSLETIQDTGVVDRVHGRGLFIGIDLVPDHTSRARFDGGTKIGTRIAERAFLKGLLVRSAPNCIVIAPPLVINDDELDKMIEILTESVREIAHEID